MKTATCSTLGLCAFVAVVGCAGTKSSDDDIGAAGSACVIENSYACLVDGGECEGAHANLDVCYAMDPSAEPCDRLYPSAGSCTPSPCYDEAEAFDACLLACEAVAVNCE